MYRKLHQPTDGGLPSVPLLVLSDRRRKDVVIGLRGLGWGRLGALVATAPGTVTITQTELRVEARGAVLVRERTPAQPAPTGWCEAVTALSGRCLIAIVPAALFSDGDELIGALRDAVDSDAIAAALIPLTGPESSPLSAR